MNDTKQIVPAIVRTNDEINLGELCSAIWQGKWIIGVITAIFTVAAIFFALNLPDIYKSEALLAPVTEESGLKIPGQLGGLAALAGVSLGGAGGDKIGLAMEIIKSRDFLGRFIEKHDLAVPIMAAVGWNRSDDSLVIDSRIYDKNSKLWVREVKAPFLPQPSRLEVHQEMLKLFSISQDKTTGMVKLSVEHYSPYLAKNWVDELVKAINEDMRQRELLEAQQSIEYLNKQVEQTVVADVRTMLYSLIEEQTKTVMLASVRDEYVFKTVDPAVVAERKSKPVRALICILAAMLGFMLSSLIVLVRHFSFKKM